MWCLDNIIKVEDMPVSDNKVDMENGLEKTEKNQDLSQIM
jgi:hypothetical protein